MNRKQRARKLDRRRNHRSHPSPAKEVYNKMKEKAKRQKKGESWVLVQMQKQGFLPTETGWRPMSARERKMWS